MVKAGKIRILSICTQDKIPEFPDIPNLYELGYNTGIRQFYLGAFVPAGTPKDRIKKLESAIEQTTKDKSFIAMMKKMNMPIIYRSGKDLAPVVEEMKQTYLRLSAEGKM